jgi:oxygen-independent coproporphyrinogen-3 oxidase
MYSRLYVHVPFCVEKCHYCAFTSFPPQSGELREYPDLLVRELQQHTSGKALASIYFGGGTPSLLHPDLLDQLLEEFNKHTGICSKAEITLEANPGTVDPGTLKGFRAAGINRISLGIQSFDPLVLKKLGRIHTPDQSHQAFQDIRSAGFTNVSIDLMHSLPNQTLDQWHTELRNAVQLGPEHISIYGLTIEEGTPFARSYPDNSPELADEDLSADMFELADSFLTGSGFEHYEIANYARHGYQSQHNSGYWRRDGYLGLGVAAHSFFREGYGVRFCNPDNLEEYRCGILSGRLLRREEQQLSKHEAMAEHLFLGLRLAEGVRLSDFEREFGLSLLTVYGSVLPELISQGLLVQNNDTIALTLRGMLLSNQVFSRFLT